MNNVTADGRVRWNDLVFVQATSEERARFALSTGDLLFNTRNSVELVGKVGIVKTPPEGAIYNNNLMRLRMPSGVNPDFICYQMCAPEFRRQLESIKKATTSVAAVYARDFFPLPIKMAPTSEQQRIVAAIEQHLSDIDAGVAALERALLNLKRYRASVLKAACEGQLVAYGEQPTTRELGDTEVGSGAPPPGRRSGRLWGSGSVPVLTDEERSALPQTWHWKKVRELGAPDEVVQVGPMSMRSQDFTPEGRPVLNVGCVRWGEFDETKLDFLPEELAGSFGRYTLRPGDVLFTRSGTVGRCAVASERHRGWLMTFHLLRVRVDPRICSPKFLRIVLEGAPHIRRQTREASIGTTRAGFNTNLLADLDVPLPPLAEQHRIVAEVDRLLSVADETEAAVRAQLARAERLRQAVLKRAFEGKLVPQDPNDEPASVMLERIRAERAGAASGAAKAPRRGRARVRREGPQGEQSDG
jgi:type I restriction enzyme S subunit